MSKDQELRLTFTDQFGHDHSAQATATLQRSARLGKSVLRARKFAGLFEAEGPEKEISFREITSGTRKWHPEHRGVTER